jgi:hypothetical protein
LYLENWGANAKYKTKETQIICPTNQQCICWSQPPLVFLSFKRYSHLQLLGYLKWGYRGWIWLKYIICMHESRIIKHIKSYKTIK